MTFTKHTITNFHISFDKNAFNLQLFQTENQGSSLYIFESELYKIVWYTADHDQNKILDFIKDIHNDLQQALETIYDNLGGVFGIFMYDKKIINYLF